MAEKWNLKRWTRIDVVVVAVLGLLVVSASPSLLFRMRTRAARLGCAANLAQIGKAMFAYANDYEGAFPRAGGPTSVWGPIAFWCAPDRYMAYGLSADGSGGSASISSSFYLLVKHYQIATKSFVCRGDRGTTEFRLSNLSGAMPKSFDLTDAWDFGPMADAFTHCSYSYHMPYGPFALTTSRDPNLAVAADRNPFIKSPGADAKLLTNFKPDLDLFRGTEGQARAGNAVTHRREGQNVLFLDGRVKFETRAYCAVEKDNIYLQSQFPDRGSPLGNVPTVGLQPGSKRDSLLVHDPDVFSHSKASFPLPGTSAVTPPIAQSPASSGTSRLYLREARGEGSICVLDDFEGYTDEEGGRIYEAWFDGWTNGTNSTIGNLVAPFAEEKIVHGGERSMPFEYDNGNSPWYSESAAMWKTPVDLTADGFDTFVLYIRGRAENGPSRFYIAVEDAAGRVGVVTHADGKLANRESWVAWRIPLSEFKKAEVDVTRAAKLYIGIGNRDRPVRGGVGVLYIDDIQLAKSSPAVASENAP